MPNMHDLSRHPFFETWTDPQTGAVSYILKERAAPIRRNFYFTNPGFSPDREYLWFTAGFPTCPEGLSLMRLQIRPNR